MKTLTIDRVAIAYLALTGVFALTGGAVGLALAAAHAVAIGLVLWLSRRPLPRNGLARFARVAYPLMCTPLLYHEISVLNRFLYTGYFDPPVQRWEQDLFGSQVSVEASVWFPEFWLSEYLNLGYLSYYFIVLVLAVAAFRIRGATGLHRFAVAVFLSFCVCYVWFIAFPVLGPRYVFGPSDGPLASGTFSRFVRAILEGGSSAGTAFPSSHVAATCSGWIAAGREDRRLFWLMAAPVTALVLGTVYGGYHYAVDALAGLLVTGLVVLAYPGLVARWGASPGADSRV